ncbi:MAG: ELWxxDGT repeat protein [Thermoanaerobaculia bacterium]
MSFSTATAPLFFFYATSNRGISGRELWVSGGTPASTFRLTGPLTFPTAPNGSRQRWVESRGLLYFTANDGVHGMELWRSDGTPAGTYMVTDLRPGAQGSEPREMATYKDRVYFTADDGVRGSSLWRSDGTLQGTQLVRDPLPSSALHEGPFFLRAAGNFLYFVALTPQGDYELWKSDGTTRGTTPLTAFVPGRGSALFYDFSRLGDRLLFVAETPKLGQELWITDGTQKGTRTLTSLKARNAFFSRDYVRYLSRTVTSNRIVFAVDDGVHGVELWATDGTVKGTALLKDICPGVCSGTYGDVPFKNGLLFGGADPAHGSELWFTDGTAAGTRLVRDLCSGPCSSYAFPRQVAGSLAYIGMLSRDLWVTDGTTTGTRQLATGLTFQDGGTYGAYLGSVGTSLLFSAYDEEHGFELWKSDGTPQGTGMLADLNTRDLGGSYPSGMQPVANGVFFFANDGLHGSELWKSDGTEAGTSLVHEFVPGPEPRHPPYVNVAEQSAGKLFFFLNTNDANFGLWRSDGTDAGTLKLTSEDTRPLGETGLTVMGGAVFFAGEDEEHGEELWKTDGTPAGTVRVTDISPGWPDSSPSKLTVFQDRLYFVAYDDLHRNELWVSDGTEAGTHLVKDINPDFDSGPDLMAEHAGRLWFFADDGEHGRELWSTDGTEAGTVLAADLAPGRDSFHADRLTWTATKGFLFGGAEGIGAGLWTTDGTSAGTRLISPVRLDTSPFVRNMPLVVGDQMLFNAQDGVRSLLWKSDGTESGTVQVLNGEGEPIENAEMFQAFAGRAFVIAGDGEVWQTDGTPSGTSLLPGRAVQDGATLVPAGGRLFFPAYDRETGVELWAIDPE